MTNILQVVSLYGKTKSGRNLHVQIALPPSVVIITAYDPDETEWINYRVRRKGGSGY